jgi:hypothetical protein
MAANPHATTVAATDVPEAFGYGQYRNKKIRVNRVIARVTLKILPDLK